KPGARRCSRPAQQPTPHRSMQPPSIRTERQIAALVGAITDLRPLRQDTDPAKRAEQCVEAYSGHQQQPHRQLPAAAVTLRDPVVPKDLVRAERGLAIHFEGEDLIELA